MTGLQIIIPGIDASGAGKNIGRILPDADAQAFVTTVGMTNQAHQTALLTFVVGLKNAGLWTKHSFLSLYYGTTAAQQKKKLIGPDSTFNNDDPSAHTSAGYSLLKSALRWEDTNVALTSSQSNYWAGVLNSTSDVSSSVLLTISNITNNSAIFLARQGPTTTGKAWSQVTPSGYDNTKKGLLLVTQTNLSALGLYDDGVLIGSNTTVVNASNFAGLQSAQIGKFNVANFESSATITYAGAGVSPLSGSEVATLNTLVKALNTAWGR